MAQIAIIPAKKKPSNDVSSVTACPRAIEAATPAPNTAATNCEPENSDRNVDASEIVLANTKPKKNDHKGNGYSFIAQSIEDARAMMAANMPPARVTRKLASTRCQAPLMSPWKTIPTVFISMAAIAEIKRS